MFYCDQCCEFHSIDTNVNVGGKVEKDWDSFRKFISKIVLVINYQGQSAANVWAGWFNKQKTRPYENDILQLVLSAQEKRLILYHTVGSFAFKNTNDQLAR